MLLQQHHRDWVPTLRNKLRALNALAAKIHRYGSGKDNLQQQRGNWHRDGDNVMILQLIPDKSALIDRSHRQF